MGAVDAVIRKYKKKPGSLIPVLEEVQEAVGYLPKPVMQRVALGLRVPFSEVYGSSPFIPFSPWRPKVNTRSVAARARPAMFGVERKSWRPSQTR